MTETDIRAIRDAVFRELASSEFCGIDAERITDDSTFEDLGMDSIDVAELSFAIEERFAIEIEDAEYAAIGSVRDLVRYVPDKKVQRT